MYHLRLIKGLSYSGDVEATRNVPDAYTLDEAIAKNAVASGFFKLIEDAEGAPDEQGENDGRRVELETKKLDELRDIAEGLGIDHKQHKNKAALVDAIIEAENKEEYNEVDFGGSDEESPTMIELQRE